VQEEKEKRDEEFQSLMYQHECMHTYTHIILEHATSGIMSRNGREEKEHFEK